MMITTAKAQVRKIALERRQRAAQSGDATAATDRLKAMLQQYSDKTLAGYIPMRSEIDPRPAMAAHKGPVCVPVIKDKGLPLAFREWTPNTDLQDASFGTEIPRTGAWLRPEVLIVPLVAFDRQGHRLGYGGGFYDRTLEDLRTHGSILTIGYAWSVQEINNLPHEPTDQRLNMIITETEVITI